MRTLLNRLLHLQVSRFEQHYDYDMSYAHEMLDISRSAFLRFSAVSKMASHNEGVPAAALFAAKIVATLAEDCGPCTQLVVKMAEEARVSAAVVRAVVEGDESHMGDEARIGWRFARAVLAHNAQADALRAEIRQRWGDKALVSFALAIAASRMFPTMKYALGHGKACQRINVGGVEIRPLSPPALAGVA